MFLYFLPVVSHPPISKFPCARQVRRLHLQSVQQRLRASDFFQVVLHMFRIKQEEEG
jgi:hypothetical protein